MKKQILIAFLLVTTFVNAQIIRAKSGDLKLLKGVDSYHVIFDYSNLKIPQFDSEEDFLNEKMAMREKRKVGDGERFKKSWLDDRVNLYEPYFINNFNNFFIKKRKIKLTKNDKNVKYTMHVKTELIYPGYNIGAFFENSKVIAIIKIYETDFPDKILFSTKRIKVLNARPDYNGGVRIANGYGLLGKAFAKYLKRKT